MKLLIPVDFSPSSETVLSEIEARPWPSPIEALVLNIVDIMGIGAGVMDPGTLLEKEREEARELVDTVTGRLFSAGVKAAGDVVLALPRSAIPGYAKEWGADFIIYGSHGHGALVRFLLGSVAKSLLRNAPCSIEIVRAVPKNPENPKDMNGVKGIRILLATDGSQHSQAAAKSIARRPWPPGSEFKVISFAEVPPFCWPPRAEAEEDSALDELREDILRTAEDAVESARKTLKNGGLDSIAAVAVGDPRTGILDEASNWSARLIVLGSHGTKETQGIAPGTVAETVALHAHCSVEVIRASG